jgi:hypothetical protein
MSRPESREPTHRGSLPDDIVDASLPDEDGAPPRGTADDRPIDVAPRTGSFRMGAQRRASRPTSSPSL